LKLAHAAWPVLAGLVIGLAAGAVWMLLQPDRYRAETRVLTRGEARGLVPAVKALAESSLLEQNLAQTLRLDDTPEISASGGNGGVVTLSTEAGSSERARQIDGEAAIVLGRLVTTRFGPGVEATLLDPAHTVEQTSPTPSRDLLLAGLIGLGAGAAVAAGRGRRRPRAVPVTASVDPAVERRLRERIAAVAKRELALARRAGEFAQREAALKQEHAVLEPARAEVAQERAAVEQERAAAEQERAAVEQERAAVEQERAAVEQERAAAVRVEPEPESEPEPERGLGPLPEPLLTPSRASWTLDELEELVRAHQGDASQQEEWQTYLFLLREHAAADGTLPRSLDGLINDVFAPILR
jgi:hypothetical protein